MATKFYGNCKKDALLSVILISATFSKIRCRTCVTQISQSNATDLNKTSIEITDQSAMIAENLQVNETTVNVLKMFSEMKALKFTNDYKTVYIKSQQLPDNLFEKLYESKEVNYNHDKQGFELTDDFVTVLASDHVFAQLGNSESIIANMKILDQLKQRVSPYLREDLIKYSRHNFFQ